MSAPPPAPQPPRPGLRIAPLQTGDAGRYRALMLQAYAADADAFTSTPQERAALPIAWWVQRIADPTGDSVALGAFDDGEAEADAGAEAGAPGEGVAGAAPRAALVGSVALAFNRRAKTRHTAELVGLYVRPAARGRGAARALVQAALQLAGQRPGVQRVKLTATHGNRAAVALYRSLGFEAFGREPMAIAVPDAPGGFRTKLHMACAVGTDAAPAAARPMLAAQIGGVRFWVRVAALLHQGPHLLVHRLAGDPFWTLPGGRLEAGEAARDGLAREFHEELGQALQIGELACSVENFFDLDGLPHQELGLYFHARLPPGAALADVGRTHWGVEGNSALEFRWCDAAALAALDLRPAVLRPHLISGRLPPHLHQA